MAPGFIENVERMIERFPQAGIYFGMYEAVGDNDQRICIERVSPWHEERYASPEAFLNEYLEAAHSSNSLSPATVYRKALIKEIGGYRSELGHWSDTFLLRAIARSTAPATLQQCLRRCAACRKAFLELSRGTFASCSIS